MRRIDRRLSGYKGARGSQSRASCWPSLLTEPNAPFVAPVDIDAMDSIPGNQLVYVVDDDEQIRESLTFVMETRAISVVSFDSGAAFFDRLNDLTPAPIILDIRMPQMDGIEFLREFATWGFGWPVIVLTGHGEITVAVQALKLGAIDFLEKPVELHEMELCLGKAFKLLETEQMSRNTQAACRKALSLLTPRESEVLEGLCSGKANKQVAYALSISPRTVEMHRSNALRRLGVRTLAEVVTLMNETKAR